MADNNDLISQAYAGIGRSDTGTGLGAITQGEKDYWSGQLASGAINPNDFQSVFNNAVNEYRTANPNDPYTQYVNNYQAQKSAITPTTAPLSSDYVKGVLKFSVENPDATTAQFADAVTAAGGLTPELSRVLAVKYGTDENTIKFAYDREVANKAAATQDKTYTDLVNNAYGTIGRTGIGTNVSNIDQGGFDYYKNQLATGAIKPEDLNNVFQNAVSAYEVANPNDPYTQYVQKYQLGKQADTIKQSLASVLQDKSISLDEANKITEYQNKYNFTPEQIASVTGYTVDGVKEILNSKNKILENTVKANINNPVALADYATKNNLTAKELAKASGGAYTETQVQANLDLSKTFQGRLQLASPEAYNKIKGITQYTADENFGGKTQDYQVQLFTPLDITKTGIPTQLEFTQPPSRTELDDGGNPYTYTPPPKVKNANVTQDDIGNFVSTTPTYINGIPVTASYDANGKITGYQGDSRVVTWLDGKHYVYGNWDAQGNAKPAQVTSKGGGFIKNFASDIAGALKDLGPAWTVAKLFNPELALVDVATDVGQGKFDLGTVVSGLSGYAGLQGANVGAMQTPGGLNSVSGLDLASDIATTGANPAVGALANASTAKLVASGLVAIDAADKGNYAPILNVVANVSGVNKMPEVAIAANTLAAADAINNNNPGALMTAAGNLVGSPDLKLAGAATKFIQAYDSGNQAAITTAGAELFSSINANVPGASTTLKNLVSDATSAISPTTTTTAPLSTGNTITYDQSGNPTSTPSGTSPTGALPSGTQVVSSDGSLPQVEVSGTPIYAESSSANKVKAPFGFELMPMALNEKDENGNWLRPSGAYYDQFQNAWFMPNEDVQDLQTAIQGGTSTGSGDQTGISPISNNGSGNGDSVVGPLTTLTPPSTSDMGNVTITDKRPVTDLPVTDMGNVTVTDKKPDYSTITDTDLLPHDVTPTTVTPTTTTTSPLASVSNSSSYTTPKQIINAPSTLASVETPSLESDPRGLTSKNKKDKKILKELEMLFGTLTPELVSALQDRGIYVPQELAIKDESAKDTSKEEDSKKDTIKEETEKEIAENKALETKLVATGGSIASTIDQPITYKLPGLLAAPALLDIPSRLGTLKHLREGITKSPLSSLSRGGLPQKYAEATPEGHKPEFITGLTGYYASGKGTGQSDDIDAMLHDGDYVADADLVAALGDGSSKAGAEALEKFRRQVPHQHSEGGQPVPAKIADGEYVFPSSFVTAIGRGDNKEGAKILDKMREAIRAHKRSAPTSKIPPKAKSPLDYLKMVKG